ncbi:MAG: sulfatase-like hydrolase/transferase [Oscillospiraceae bacterium]|jgi:phosphoglycerol transferase MdoB-like AlkP superfamily enzyme
MFHSKKKKVQDQALNTEAQNPEITVSVAEVSEEPEPELHKNSGRLCTRIKTAFSGLERTLRIGIRPIRRAGRKSYRRFRTVYDWLDQRPLLQLIVTALLVNLVVEMLQRHSVIGALRFLFTHPFVFLCGMLIVLFTISFSLLFRKRHFWRILLSSVWLILGVIDFVVLFFRTTPLAEIDFELMTSVASIISVYLNTFQLVMVIIFIVLVIALFIVMLIKTKRQKVKWKQTLLGIVGSGVLMSGAILAALHVGAVSTHFPNLPIAYRNYGFVYCFTSSIVDRGISKPSNYSSASISEILAAINETENNTTAGVEADVDHPNVIFLQLESFFDVNLLNGVTYTQNPIPNFTKLKENYISGYLNVPSFGAGTANTEFEILTGMTVSDFGSGEYPYKTILQDNTCESLCYNLKELGYATHAIHNHYATFYDRNLVFSHLGFDTFTSLEYMSNISYTPRGWCTDLNLDSEILNTLESTENQDFIYTISVQGHGQYPAHKTYGLEGVSVRSGIEEEETANAFTYYLRMINQTDAFIGNLIEQLKNYDEPTVVVMYGDHLPTFDFLTNQSLENGDIYATEYVIWSNFGLTDESTTMYSYQLGAYVMDLLDYNNGVITKLHQRYKSNANYKTALKMLEYDMLYGDGTAYQGETPKATVLQLGVNDVAITDVTNFRNELLFLHGNGFTRYATCCVDGKEQETKFISEHLLMVELDRPLAESCDLTLQFAGKDKEVLTVTEPYPLVIAGSDGLSQDPVTDDSTVPDSTQPDATVPNATESGKTLPDADNGETLSE